jgi:hypothetical protein
MAKDDSVTVPGNTPEGVNRCFPLRHLWLVPHRMELQGRCAQPSSRGLEAETGPGRRLKKEDAYNDAARELRHGRIQTAQLFTAIEDGQELLPTEISDVEKMVRLQ